MDRYDVMGTSILLVTAIFNVTMMMPFYVDVLDWVLNWLYYNVTIPLYSLIYEWISEFLGA